ncbi:hypothetical protein FQA39_LY04016 [Lamprigera yunnana]|nr:hypothetical protein FQA39_LY04016 [Lamprigera yunnana]
MGLYPAKGQNQNYNRLYYMNPHEDSFDAEADDQIPLAPNSKHYRRVNGSPSNINGIPELSNKYNRRSEKIIKRGLSAEEKQPLGLVYRKGKLLGILEPYPALYELSPYFDAQGDVAEMSSMQPVEDTQYLSHSSFLSDDEETDQSNLNNLIYTDDKYPMILTDFESDPRLDSFESNKRGKMQISDKQPKNTKVKHLVDDNEQSVENPSDMLSDEINDDNSDLLQGIDAVEDVDNNLNLGQLNSKNFEKNKREIHSGEKLENRDAGEEDENLNEGSNKIDIIKITHDIGHSEKMKREVDLDKEPMDVESEFKSTESTIIQQINSENGEVSTTGVRDYQNEEETYFRNKRNEISTENTDIMKGLEKSGDLTVSGNKSPLASSENDSKITEKRKNDDIKAGPSLAEASADSEEYEGQLEKSIQQRIDAIKEEVKREIASLREKAKVQMKEKDELERQKRMVESKMSNLDPPTQPEVFSRSCKRAKRNTHSSDLTQSLQS